MIRALLRCGASLTDLHDWYDGKLSDPNFLDFILSFYVADNQYNSHQKDALNLEEMKRRKRELAKHKPAKKPKVGRKPRRR